MNARPIEARGLSAGCPRRPPRISLLFSLILLMTLIPIVSWGSVSSEVRRGNKEYDREKFDQALQHYRDAQLEDPESPPLHFNIANALHKQQNWEEALAEYGMTLSTQDSALAEGAYYNLGNTLYRQEKLPEAVEAYKKALRLNPDDLDAKYNLELAQLKLQESPQQQQSQEQKDKESQEEQQEQQQGQQQEQQQQEKQQKQGEKQEQQDQRQQQEPGEQEQRQQQQAQEQEEKQQPSPRPAEPGQMSPEEAAQILNALEEQEKKAQEERLQARSAKGARSEWDW